MASKVYPASPAGVGWPTRQPPGPVGTKTTGYYFGCPTALILPLAVIGILPLLLVVAPLALLLNAVQAGLVFIVLWTYLGQFLRDSNWYTKILLISYKSLLFSRKPPTAKTDMLVSDITPKAPLKTAYIEYALNIAVPLGTEEEFIPRDGQSSLVSFTGSLAAWFEAGLARWLPVTTSWTRFAPDEDPVKYVMDRLGDAYPPVRTVYNEKLTDRALTQLCFYGIGAHRLWRAQPLTSPEDTVTSGDYVVRTNMLAELPVRPGLDTYGGDAYFDEHTWAVQKIVRRLPADNAWEDAVERTYYPGDATTSP